MPLLLECAVNIVWFGYPCRVIESAYGKTYPPRLRLRNCNYSGSAILQNCDVTVRPESAFREYFVILPETIFTESSGQ